MSKNPALAKTFDRLLKLAERHYGGGMRGVSWLSADLVDQEALYEIQADYLEILAEVGRLLGPDYEKRLTADLPWAFKLVTP